MTLTTPDAVGAPPPERAPRPQLASTFLPGRCRSLINHRWFDLTIVAVIAVNAIVLGLGTYADIASRYERLFSSIYNVILGIYVIELLIQLTAYRWSPREFVKDGWNVFDFLVVVASFVTSLRANAMLLRLVRLLRIVRIVHFLLDLRVLVAAAGRSVPGIV